MKDGRKSALRLRPGRESDLDDVIRIWRALWRESYAGYFNVAVDDTPWMDDIWHEFLPVMREFLIAEIHGRVVGFTHRDGAQLTAADGTLLNRDYARAWLPADLAPGAQTKVQIELPVPASPGRYGLKFDLVSEGIDWFEACGSPTTVRELWVS